ncbi:HesB/IscA family protein [Thioalbus denitrificans]|jgi:iron-sulfur cluster assembly protein|uniref:Iron-sulfur cluster assembly protein n=1 Tax=Thioalbus denitrificans TaxID=547122 RepID=A0A369CHL5_9GAMM|nr:iron-sulfur cluster biosynthesis family protein [Thioalbus denitrificans]RCX31957.1 iron-sulfur cluster assembly protein [Thioalbus denitrificans]
MFKITERAAEQVRRSMEQGEIDGLALRVAVRTLPDGGFDYGLGFDAPAADDLRISSQGVEILINPALREMLEGTVMDFVELESGEMSFIFLNPNDPNYIPPKEADVEVPQE